MMFHVGQKVVCVDDSPGAYSGIKVLRLNAVYTITHVFPWNGVLLAEVDPPPPPPAILRAFSKDRFRPLIERKTDISVFQQIARDVTEGRPVKITEPTR
jgi:hypothetical protein